MIGLDWGTTRLRAFRIAEDGVVRDFRRADRGVLSVKPGGFADVLREIAGDWLAAGERRVLIAGMAGSRQGWLDVPYLDCPAAFGAIAAAARPVAFEGAEVLILPGLATRDGDGVPEVMRGEETQIVGAVGDDARRLVCLPGSHSKWAIVGAGRIEGFRSYMTGEAFAALGGSTILAQTIEAGGPEPDAFADGVARARQPGGLLHHLFGVRTRVLRDGVSKSAARAYLSGLLIGHEICHEISNEIGRARPAAAEEVTLIGDPALCGLYRDAIALCGGAARVHDDGAVDAACLGLARLGAQIPWQH
ncbi:MAG TPA: 2-dehydro-3-deoxygalactonokinase [Acidiphilium sp.]|nr:2-dehydro-3-deoxygalactonokinase [Acidiphilium sp.]